MGRHVRLVALPLRCEISHALKSNNADIIAALSPNDGRLIIFNSTYRRIQMQGEWWRFEHDSPCPGFKKLFPS